MTRHPALSTEPWAVSEVSLDVLLDLGTLARAELLFTLSNVHLGLRGNLDVGEPFGLPRTYRAGCDELRPLEAMRDQASAALAEAPAPRGLATPCSISVELSRRGPVARRRRRRRARRWPGRGRRP